MGHLLYIPTDRSCLPALTSGLREAVAMSTVSPCHFAVIEHREAPYLKEHAALLRETASGPYGQALLHVTPQTWVSFLEEVLQKTPLGGAERERIGSMYSTAAVAYGIGPNKAALLAASLHARFLHRRDSDQVPDVRDGDPWFPYVLEVASVGRRVDEVAGQWPVRGLIDDQDPLWESRVPIAGSGLIGDLSLDRRDLDEVGQDLSARIHALAVPDVPVHQLRSRLRAKYGRGPSVRHNSDFFEIDTTGTTEMGNSCMVHCFTQMPEMPIVETLATDYTIKNLLYQVRAPVLYHSRKMIHTYDDKRRAKKPATVVRYSLRDLRYMIMRRVRTALNREITEFPGAFVDASGAIDGPAFAAKYAAHLEEMLPHLAEVPAAYAEIYAEAADRATAEAAVRLAAIRDGVRQAGHEPIQTVASGIRDFCWLAERWGTLVAAATEVDPALFRVAR